MWCLCSCLYIYTLVFWLSRYIVVKLDSIHSAVTLFFLLVGPPYCLHMRVKFYSSEPNNLHEELTRSVKPQTFELFPVPSKKGSVMSSAGRYLLYKWVVSLLVSLAD